MKRAPQIELYAGGHGFYWRLRGANGKIQAVGADPAPSKSAIRKQVKRMVRNLATAYYTVGVVDLT